MSIKDLFLKIKGECWNSIFLFNHRTKTAFRGDFFTAVVIILVAFAGFGLGRLSALEGKKMPILIERSSSSLSSTNEAIPNKNTVSIKTTQNPSEKSFVAAKSGTKYYFPWCGGVSRIKEENKIWFASETEATKAGYQPAANCKGLK
ncbi:MAG: Endonuclease I [Parcubacteria group bacterium GW2011_GWA1_40_21]|nr:MAG: Endonuclease I [Parcubacteria group bacterium GW2011_GWC1_40_13]KKR53094.1 MAG: Endonuclease I [Parcubacteria group bacterium GW2011_GWA1_40_21]